MLYRMSETYICNIDNSNLRFEQVHLEGLLPVGDQLKRVGKNQTKSNKSTFSVSQVYTSSSSACLWVKRCHVSPGENHLGQSKWCWVQVAGCCLWPPASGSPGTRNHLETMSRIMSIFSVSPMLLPFIGFISTCSYLGLPLLQKLQCGCPQYRPPEKKDDVWLF